METKVYCKPEFELIRQNESNKVFFTASSGPGPSPAPTSVGGTLSKMTFSNAEW